MSYVELLFLGLAVGLGANFGPLGIGLCIAIIVFPIFSRQVKRYRSSMVAIRRNLGLGMPTDRADV